MAERGRNERGGPLGGNELPPDVQDRPDQNKGYDEAVEGASGRPGAMQVGTTGITEERRNAEAREDARPASDKAEGD